MFVQDIDEYICQAKDKSYDTLVHFGRKGLNVAATAAVMAAAKVTPRPDPEAVVVCKYTGFVHAHTKLHASGLGPRRSVRQTKELQHAGPVVLSV